MSWKPATQYGTAAAGMLLGGAIGAATGHRWCHPALWGLGAYASMAIPDIPWLAARILTGSPYEHRPWMDLFLAHDPLDHWSLAAPLVVPVYLASMGAIAWSQQRAPRPP